MLSWWGHAALLLNSPADAANLSEAGGVGPGGPDPVISAWVQACRGGTLSVWGFSSPKARHAKKQKIVV